MQQTNLQAAALYQMQRRDIDLPHFIKRKQKPKKRPVSFWKRVVQFVGRR